MHMPDQQKKKKKTLARPLVFLCCCFFQDGGKSLRKRIEVPTVSRYLRRTQEIAMRSHCLSPVSGKAGGEEVSRWKFELPSV